MCGNVNVGDRGGGGEEEEKKSASSVKIESSTREIDSIRSDRARLRKREWRDMREDNCQGG